MGLETRYRESFSKSQKESGHTLFTSNSVSYIQGNDEELNAEVTEEQNLYEVKLQCSGKELKMYCDCKGAYNRPCNHIWSVLLAADQLKLLKNGSKRGVRLAGTAAAKQAGRTVKPVSAREQINNQPPVLNSISATSAPVDREVLFVVNKSMSKWAKTILIELFWRPLSNKSSIKPYIPDSDNIGFSMFDQSMLYTLSSLGSVRSSELAINENKNVLATLESLVESDKLFSREGGNQYKFAKIKECLIGEIDWDFELTTDGYDIKAECCGETLEGFYYVSEHFLILPRKLVKFSSSQKALLPRYISEFGASVPAWKVEEFLAKTLVPSQMKMEHFPGRMKCTREKAEPRGLLHVRTATFKFRDKEQLHAELHFDYLGKTITEDEQQSEILDFYGSRVLQRNFNLEEKLRSRLNELGFRFNEESHKEEYGWKLLPVKLPAVVDALLKEGWQIIADGKSYKAPVSFQLRLSSGEDWLELNGEAVFDGETIIFPELMKQGEKKERYVQLGDGSFGVLPEEWLKNYTVLTQLGEMVDGNLRFQKSQALIIENLLQEKLSISPEIKEYCRNVKESAGYRVVDEPENFKGQLRPYQKQGLSWLIFLREAGLSGILADDMGLGKTIQILALLSSIWKKAERPTLLIVPKSLIFNWIEEASKFSPFLKVLEYTGPSRKKLIKEFRNNDIIISTYGTVRQDIERLSKVKFEYCILDEAQAIKNRDSSTHKAVKLIDSKFRVSMSGTPVENSLSDLISQFEFLNPGMTGHGKINGLLNSDEKLSRKNLQLLKEGFKPFILRRTKSQVAKDLPPKSEQVIYCDMDESQKKLYEKMLKFYQQQLSQDKDQNQFEYLGALTRLRQMSCHPALIDENFENEESTKLEVLLSKLDEIISEGHRALIFSQFTSFLGIIKNALSDKGWKYNYLDGGTKNRQEVVENFQEGDAPVFLISLKAGGVGLNLTAADYVFLMDPWWNPAIESQAIDRAYRIGQDKKVIACKLITKNTVEEKVLKMQRVKKHLSNSLISDDNRNVEKLTIEDFKKLLE